MTLLRPAFALSAPQMPDWRSASSRPMASSTPRSTDPTSRGLLPGVVRGHQPSEPDVEVGDERRRPGRPDDGELRFHFDGCLPSGAAAPFGVVDVATLAPYGKIKNLHIICDTVDVRPAFEAAVGRSSWRWSRSESS